MASASRRNIQNLAATVSSTSKKPPKKPIRKRQRITFLREIQFNGQKVHRLLTMGRCQCPLLALGNALLLNNDIRINRNNLKMLTMEQLTYCLKDHLHRLFAVDIASQGDIDADVMAVAIQNIEDSVNLFKTLRMKWTVNLEFSGLVSLRIMFENFKIPLLVDGSSDLKGDQIAVLFRKRSFFVVHKRDGIVWELVTDKEIIDKDPKLTWKPFLFVDDAFKLNGRRFISTSTSPKQSQS